MTRKLEQTPTDDQDSVAGSASSRTIAARIGNFATNLLVTGVILIVGIAFAREITAWWRSDASSTETSPLVAVVGDHAGAASADRQLLEFGDFPFVLNRQQFVGDATQALAQLRADCRAAVESSEPLAREFSPAEQRMLDAAQRLAPVEEQANRWSIHQIDRPLPMVVGVRSFDRQVATPARRVVSWGLAVPDATPDGERQSAWTLFTYSSDTTVGTMPDRMLRPAPPGGQRTLSLRTDRGETVVGYVGTGTVESWTRFYDDLFAPWRSQPDDSWQVDFGSWRRRFTSAESESVDVVISLGDKGTIRGLVITSPNKILGL